MKYLSLFFLCTNYVKSMTEIELFTDYSSYHFYLLDCFYKIIFHIMGIFPSLPLIGVYPKWETGAESVFTLEWK